MKCLVFPSKYRAIFHQDKHLHSTMINLYVFSLWRLKCRKCTYILPIDLRNLQKQDRYVVNSVRPKQKKLVSAEYRIFGRIFGRILTSEEVPYTPSNYCTKIGFNLKLFSSTPNRQILNKIIRLFDKLTQIEIPHCVIMNLLEIFNWVNYSLEFKSKLEFFRLKK